MKFTCPSNDASPLAPSFCRHLVQKNKFPRANSCTTWSTTAASWRPSTKPLVWRRSRGEGQCSAVPWRNAQTKNSGWFYMWNRNAPNIQWFNIFFHNMNSAKQSQIIISSLHPYMLAKSAQIIMKWKFSDMPMCVPMGLSDSFRHFHLGGLCHGRRLPLLAAYVQCLAFEALATKRPSTTLELRQGGLGPGVVVADLRGGPGSLLLKRGGGWMIWMATWKPGWVSRKWDGEPTTCYYGISTRN